MDLLQLCFRLLGDKRKGDFLFQSLGRMVRRSVFPRSHQPNPVLAGTTGKIIGQITDSRSGEPLIGANVVLEGTSLGGSTDVDGFLLHYQCTARHL